MLGVGAWCVGWGFVDVALVVPCVVVNTALLGDRKCFSSCAARPKENMCTPLIKKITNKTSRENQRFFPPYSHVYDVNSSSRSSVTTIIYVTIVIRDIIARSISIDFHNPKLWLWSGPLE